MFTFIAVILSMLLGILVGWFIHPIASIALMPIYIMLGVVGGMLDAQSKR